MSLNTSLFQLNARVEMVQSLCDATQSVGEHEGSEGTNRMLNLLYIMDDELKMLSEEIRQADELICGNLNMKPKTTEKDN